MTLAFWMTNEGPKIKLVTPERNMLLADAKSHTNCSDFDGAVQHVKQVAQFRGYLHQFEYDRLHPCCGRPIRAPVDTSDIVFVVMTTAKTEAKARAVLESWGRGLEHLILISDEANAQLGSIALEDDRESANHGEAKADPAQDLKHRQIWALKWLYADKATGLRSKKWFFLADDDTWVNVPALLDLLSKYDFRCPVTFGYVWSNMWIEDLDYVSGGAGILMSQEAFMQLTPSFYTDDCPFFNYNDVTFGRCSWAKQVQIVHHRGFYFDPPDRSKDRHEVVWLPPIAEAVTYHYVHPTEMLSMSEYANERWQYTPKHARFNSTVLSASPQFISSVKRASATR